DGPAQRLVQAASANGIHHDTSGAAGGYAYALGVVSVSVDGIQHDGCQQGLVAVPHPRQQGRRIGSAVEQLPPAGRMLLRLRPTLLCVAAPRTKTRDAFCRRIEAEKDRFRAVLAE